MEEGFLLDKADANLPSPQEWVEGQPVPFWTGLKRKGKDRLRVTTNRCPNCGRRQSCAPAD